MTELVQREWRRLHLRGTHWWEGTAFPADRQRESARADAIRVETEEGLTKHLVEGWSIASVVGAGPVLLFRSRVGELWQEAFNVFIERPMEPKEGG